MNMRRRGVAPSVLAKAERRGALCPFETDIAVTFGLLTGDSMPEDDGEPVYLWSPESDEDAENGPGLLP